MDTPIRSSEHTTEFHRPRSVELIKRFDPELRLVYNRRHQLFQLFRVVPRVNRYQTSCGFAFAYVEPTLIHVTELYLDEVADHDDPLPIIEHLMATDTKRNPKLDQERRQLVREERLKREAFIHGEYEYAHRWNRRQLHRGWAPFVGYAHTTA